MKALSKLLACLSLFACAKVGLGNEPDLVAAYDRAARPFSKELLFSTATGRMKQRSKVRFDEFTQLTLDNAELWRLALESV